MNPSSPDPTHVPSTDLILYDPTLPHISVKAHLDTIVEKAFKYETKHLSPEIPLKDRRLCQILPPLTGPYTVGRVSLILDVPKEYSSRHESNEKIGIEIFAPTRSVGGNKVLMQMRPGYRAGNPPTELTEQQIQSLHSHALDLDHLDQIENMSILVFSHGMGVDPVVYRPLVEELASHGFVVLNLNHPEPSCKLKSCSFQSRSS